ncbi:MAG: Rv3235 family protein [Beutenbergiaceae bacterium]
MSALATIDSTSMVVSAPTRIQPAGLAQPRPRDRIAFRAIPASDADREQDEESSWPSRSADDMPDPVAWSGALVRTCVEVLLGSRAPAQLTRWLTADLYLSLSQQAAMGRGHGADARRVVILRVHDYAVDEGHHESAVVLHDGRRVRAAALRIESYRGRWRASALEIG